MNTLTLTLLCGAAYVAGAAAVVWVSLQPDAYYFATAAERSAWRWAWPPVAFVCLLMALEALLVWAILVSRGGWALWKRALGGIAVLVPWMALSAIFVIHGSGYFGWHVLWLCALVAILLLCALASLGRAAADRLRRAPRGLGSDRTGAAT
ncbi:hypothetical protein [Roseisolibacter sp. H3M3-2]|uniref:hypothetical protein n=1 Tax=Roseisolibacter sp. H3M3-2 TaxID=3031323 RepID=UPI0023DB78CF|nr:hypothetical protein [Roseisolibacter sp. H3M3-2]MDF1501812.1 hypothetical protein [Roseisolibacter sp. H3M3-2]